METCPHSLSVATCSRYLRERSGSSAGLFFG